MTINKKKVLEELSYRRLHLYSDYRILNSNHIFGQGTLPYIGHRPYCKQLEAFLSNSDGGAVLITWIPWVWENRQWYIMQFLR